MNMKCSVTSLVAWLRGINPTHSALPSPHHLQQFFFFYRNKEYWYNKQWIEIEIIG